MSHFKACQHFFVTHSNNAVASLNPVVIFFFFLSFLPTASLGVRWMIGQTEIKRASNYGNKEVSLNNN